MKKLVKILLLLVVAVIGLIAILYLAFPETLLNWGIAAERDRAGLERREAQIDGWPWAWLEGGPEDGETILLLHGFGGDKDNWTRFARSLTDRYRVIAPDLPGFGDNARRMDASYDMPSQAPRLRAFVEHLGLTRYHIGGNSMGGNLAGYYAALHRDEIRSVGFFCNSGVASPEPSEMDQAVARGENPLLVRAPADFERNLDFIMEHRPTLPPAIIGVLARRSMNDADFRAMVYEQYKPNRRAWLEQYLPELTMPVLVLWGRQDRLIDVSTIETMKPLLANETVVIMENTGHVPMLERPAATAEHYQDFLQSF